mgnify:CR=1 FL=1
MGIDGKRRRRISFPKSWQLEAPARSHAAYPSICRGAAVDLDLDLNLI